MNARLDFDALPPLAELQPLRAVLEQAERARDAALADLRRAEAAEQGAQQQSEMLARFSREYDERWGARPGRAGTPALLHCAHGFVQRLDQARHQQGLQCRQLADRTARARAAWQACELRLAAVRKLIERRLQAAQAAAGRRAQRQTDEAAQRVARAAPTVYRVTAVDRG